LFLASGCGGGGGSDAGDAPPAADAHAHHHGDPPAGDAAPSSAKHARLLDIASQLEASGERYFGRGRLEELTAMDTTGFTNEQHAERFFQIGWELFKLDRPAEAESLFAASAEYAPGRADYFLGVAQLRTGERQNCIAHHTAESCIFPLAGGGVHVALDGATRAQATFSRLIERSPMAFRPQVRWFVNLAAMARGDWPGDLPDLVRIDPDVFASAYDIGRFRDVGLELGISPMNLAGGVAMEDFDGDDRLDIITSTADIRGQLRFFRNEGDGTFSDRTEAAGLTGQLGGLNLIHADFDGDGHRDVLVLRGGWMGTWGRIPASLLRNQGDGTFVDVTDRAGLTPSYPTQTAAFADYDLDGDLDLFIGNETPPPASGMKWPCQLFRNEGDGTFTEVAEAAGVQNFRLAKGCAWGDWDADGDPDLYVSNQFDLNRLYRNEGDGSFTDVAPELGVDEPRLSFPVWFWDFDNDGGLDLFVAGYGGDLATLVKSYLFPNPRFGLNSLYRNEGGKFRDVATERGLILQTLTMGANFGDLDNDGWLDFYLGTGTPEFDALMPDVMYRSDGGQRFVDVTTSGGFGNLQKGHGIAWGDLDADGDQDVYLQSGGIYAYDAYFNSLFLNPGHGNRWVTLELVGTRSNRDAFGARVRVRFREGGVERSVYRWVGPSGSFGSSSLRLEIGLGQAERIVGVDVLWPGDREEQAYPGVEMGAFWRLTQDDASPRRVRLEPIDLAAR
jgi:hypothetical protein